MRRLIPFACLLLPLSIAAQSPPSTSKAEAKAEASANSSGSESKKSSSSQTVTHRKVVVNGKTIVDEKKVNNKPSKGGMPGVGIDIEKMKREMMDKLREQMKKDGGMKIRPPLRVTTDLPGARERLREVLRPNKPVVPDLKTPKAKPSQSKGKASKNKASKVKPIRGTLVPRTRKTGDTSRRLR